MRALVVTLFSESSGSSRVMAFQFLPLLAKLGVETDVITIYPDEFFKVHMGILPAARLKKSLNFGYYLARGIAQRLKAATVAGRYDVVYVQRDPFPTPILRLMQRNNPRIVYEFEDAFESTNPFVDGRSFLHRSLMRYQLGLFRGMVESARHVIASNQRVADEAVTVNPNVTVLCEPLDLERYRVLPKKNVGEGPVIGWIGSPSTTSFLHSVRAPLKALSEKYPNLTLRAVGAGEHLDLPGVRVDRRPWSQETEVRDLCSFDIGIMPLSSDPFYRAHLGHKMIQYMAVGIPIVASHTPINETVVQQGSNGYLVENDGDWVQKLSLLLDDAELRGRMGRVGRALVEERFALERQAEILAGVFEKVARQGSAP